LTNALIAELGDSNVIAADLVDSDANIGCKYYKLDVTDKETYNQIVEKEEVDYILHLAAILSSLGEKYPKLAYDVNVNGAANAFDIAKEHDCQLFMPSSIAVFGGDAFPKDMTPNDVIL
jgi:nucleoside-diphosphate-sugar epimerase